MMQKSSALKTLGPMDPENPGPARPSDRGVFEEQGGGYLGEENSFP